MARPYIKGEDTDEDKKLKIDPQYQRNISFLSQLGDKRRPLDRMHIDSMKERIEVATDPTLHAVYDEMYAYGDTSGRVKIKSNLPQAAKEELEKKVRSALRDEYNEQQRLQSIKDRQAANEMHYNTDDDDPSRPNSSSSRRSRPLSPQDKASQNKVVLDTRVLLPYYKAEDVRHFMDIFTKVDEDFSGDLDMNEWVRLFGSIDHSIPEQEARSIFMKFKNDKGVLTVNELIPVVFSKATKDQIKLIVKFCLAEIMRPATESVVLTFAEIDQLFETYDVENVGFVAVGFIRDKVREMPLSDNVISNFLSTIKDIDEDEMVNHREFGRMFKHLVSKQEIMSQRDEELRAEKNSMHRMKMH